MCSAWGDALLSLSKSVPAIATSFADEGDRKRKAAADKLAIEVANINIADKKRENKLGEDARTAASDFQTMSKEAQNTKNTFEILSGLDSSKMKTEAPGESSLLPDDQYDRTQELNRFNDKSKLEQMNQFNLPQMAGYDKGVAAMVKSGKEEDNVANVGILAGYYNQRKTDALKKVRIKYPDLSEDEVFDLATDYMNSPSFMTQSGDTGLERMYKLKKTQKLGSLDPEVVTDEAGRAAKIEEAKIAPKVEAAYLTKDAQERALRDIQKKFPMLKGDAVKKVTNSALALKSLYTLKKQLEAGNLDYFDMVKNTGQFTNPDANNAFQQIGELFGRDQSGAAINTGEWKQFGKDILNKNFLLTPDGRRVAAENLADYMDRFFSSGQLLTGDDKWFQSYTDRAKAGRKAAEETLSEPTTPIGPKQKFIDAAVAAGYSRAEAEAEANKRYGK